MKTDSSPAPRERRVSQVAYPGLDKRVSALSETVPTPASPAATPMTDTLERTTLNPADWIALSRTLELKNADLRKAKQMADHERDAMLEELIALRSAPSATGAMPKAFYEIVEVANTEGMPDSTPLPIWPKDVAWDFTPLTVGDIRAMIAAATASASATEATEPAAWLITGGKMYQDVVCLTEKYADERLASRKDGSHKIPLYRAAPSLPVEAGTMPCGLCGADVKLSPSIKQKPEEV